ncbi:MAG: glutathione S-transferase family protein [Bdellovibrionota bacterium]
MIYLHQYPPAWGLSSLSPFCIKVEAFLRHNQLAYEVVVERNPRRGPKGKMPFVVDKGVSIADSSFIISSFIRDYNLEGYNKVSSTQKAAAHAFEKMIEENLYFILMYARWVDPESRRKTVSEFAKLFPPVIGALFLKLIRRNLAQQAYLQGIGRHTANEVYAKAEQDLQALSDYMQEQQYFLGSVWSPIDASLFGFLVTMMRQPVAPQLKELVQKFSNLIAYAEREAKRLSL